MELKSKEKSGGKVKEENILLTFLEKTKEGQYAAIEKTSIPYSRLKEETETIESCEENYYYNMYITL